MWKRLTKVSKWDGIGAQLKWIFLLQLPRGCAILFHLSVSYPPFQGIFQDLSKALIALNIFQRPALSYSNQVRANDLQQVVRSKWERCAPGADPKNFQQRGEVFCSGTSLGGIQHHSIWRKHWSGFSQIPRNKSGIWEKGKFSCQVQFQTDFLLHKQLCFAKSAQVTYTLSLSNQMHLGFKENLFINIRQPSPRLQSCN